MGYNGLQMTSTRHVHLDLLPSRGRSADAPPAPSHGHTADIGDALEFINTFDLEQGQPAEHLVTAADVLEWLHRRNLVHLDARDRQFAAIEALPAEGERLLELTRGVRAAMREVVEATVAQRTPDPAMLALLNRTLRTRPIYELVLSADGVSFDHRHEGDPFEGALAFLAESVARVVSQGQPDRLRVCANPECQIVFYDTSRNGQRRWCDMATCGNRAKVARFRARRRARPAVPGPGARASLLHRGSQPRP